MYLIGIGGRSGAGKTALAQALARKLNAPMVALDSYYRPMDHLALAERAHCNFDHPDALDHELLFSQMRSLVEGDEIEVPVYDFATHTRTAETERIRTAEFGIIEGLWMLHWDELRQLLGTKVYIEAGDKICCDRRLERDTRERGRSTESVLSQYATTVRPMAEKYIVPTAQYADVVVSGVNPIGDSVEAVLQHVRTAGPVVPPGRTRERG